MSSFKPIYVLNGPNLNLLGQREPEIYGRATLADIEKLVSDKAGALGLAAECRQSNHEGELVTWIQEAREKASGLILNAAAYTHTSVALQNAPATPDSPVRAVHISNTAKRGPLRQTST